MNKLQPSPLSMAREAPAVQRIAPWASLPANLEQTRFFRSWLVYDSDLDLNRTHGRLNWNMIGGVALMLAVSAAGWTGVAWLMAQLWR